MKIKLKEITVRELADGYEDNAESGVTGYGGKLNIRPPYQREFIYNDKQRNAVIDTVSKNFPLNVMYWAVREDGGFEIIDGQQRTVSLCQFVAGAFSMPGIFSTDLTRGFFNLQDDEQDKILDYKLMIYQCSGSDSEKLDWFKIVNIAGATLTDQELRNAVYSGSWVTDAKRYFSKTGCAAYQLGGDYLNGKVDRQAYLETVIKWMSDDNIEAHMAAHQHEEEAEALWEYFRAVIAWVESVFTNYRKDMKGIGWGVLYNEFKDKKVDAAGLETEIAKLMEDEDVTKKPGIYPFVLTRDEKHLNIRAFSKNHIREAYERQKGICVWCKDQFELSEMEADHITPWSEGGKTAPENCQMLCRQCNREKSNN